MPVLGTSVTLDGRRLTSSGAWVEPEPALPTPSLGRSDDSDADAVLTLQQTQHWRENGWLLVSHVFPDELVTAAAAAAVTLYPEGRAPGSVVVGQPGDSLPASAREAELEAEVRRLRGVVGNLTDGRGVECSFPFAFETCDALNQQTLHPRFLKAVQQLLGVEAIRVTQASVHDAVGDRTVGDRVLSNDRGHHQDYGNNGYVIPARHRFDTVACIVYHSDVEVVGAPTPFVPDASQDEMFGPLHADGHLDCRKVREQGVRSREVLPRFKPGTLLFYHEATFHRATAVFSGERRMTSHYVFRRDDSPWVQWRVPT